MIDEAIILAGGLGTRLRDVVKDLPKPMASVRGRPFLCYVLEFLANQGVNRAVLSVGYRHEAIEDYFGSDWEGIDLAYAIEHAPLGTGGAIVLASRQVHGNDVYVLNGDTYFAIELEALAHAHLEHGTFTMALKPMRNFDRYGTVRIDGRGRIVAFEEKRFREEGLINGGIYALNRHWLGQFTFPEAFSFEQECCEKQYKNAELYGLVLDAPFIDIGIPEDYQRAQTLVGIS